jgi:hypothetical protein
MLKKSFIALSTVLSLSSAYAGTAGEAPVCDALCADTTMTGFYGSIMGSWLRPSETDIGMVTDSWQRTDGNGVTTAEDRPADTKHEFEGSFAIGYDFAESANSIEFNYFHLKNSTNAVNVADGANLFSSYFFPGATFPPTPDFVSNATLKYTVNQADIKLARRYSQMDGLYSIRPAMGVRYAELKHDLSFIAPGYVRSEFSGAGPMFSVDGSYKLGHGFHLLGYFDSSLLVGNVDAKNYLSFGGGTTYFTKPNHDRLVTTISGRLAVDYTYGMANGMNIAIEGGYQASEYFNAFDLLRGNVVFNPALAGNGIQDIITTNFAVTGPYIKLAMHA